MIVAQRNTPKAAAVGRLVAHAGDRKAALGEQEQSGRWPSRPTRAAFLCEASQRLRVLSTPQHSRWLPQLELWGSMLVRRLLKRGNCTSGAD